MVKRFLIMAVMAVSMLLASAQTPLPLNPAVRQGTLPNGLSYYILHNSQPKERANFYIAQKVGSTLEAPDQLGLAHFLEHMAFNGTSHFPGKSMLEYLQSKGIRFGADINAATGFDETIYNINNVPTNDKALMDSVLLVLHDWSGSILLEDAEIEAERGVIEEEWRMRDNAIMRLYTMALPQLFEEYQYQQMPIGKMEIVRNFKPDVLRAYYKKWYRPDLQGIVIVGDFDAAEMEERVKKAFADIKLPENAEPRVYPEVSDNKEPIFISFSDKEFPYPIVSLYIKTEKMPFEMRNTLENYVGTQVAEALIAGMLNERLSDFAKTPECKYVNAEVSFGDYLVAKTKAAFDLEVVAKDDVAGAFAQAAEVVARACKAGFNDTELARAREKLLAGYESAFKEKDNISNDQLGDELCRHFLNNDPAPGVETEYQLMQQMLPMLPVEALNQGAAQLLTPENRVMIVAVPEGMSKDGLAREQMVGLLDEKINAQYEAYTDMVITEPLISALPAPGKVASTEKGKFGTTEFRLSNGVKVVLKPTDFKSDEVLMEAVMKGGKSSFAMADAPFVLLAEDAYDSSKLGNFDRKTLGKYLAGKKASLGFTFDNHASVFKGESTVKDLPTLMELIYASFTELNPDQEAYDVQMEQGRNMLKNLEGNPNMVFQKRLMNTVSGGNAMYQQPSVALIDAGDYGRELAMLKQLTSNAADWTFVFTGNVSAETLKPLLEQYIATLPSAGKKGEAAMLTDMDLAKGKVSDIFDQPMLTPSTMVYTVASGRNVPYSVGAAQKVELFGNILSEIYLRTLREEESGTYAPGAFGILSPEVGTWQIVTVFQTNAAQQEQLMNRAKKEFAALLADGATPELFNKSREAARKQYEINERTNTYWRDNLAMNELGYDLITGYKEALDALTLEDFNKFISSLYDGENYIEVVMQGIEQK